MSKIKYAAIKENDTVNGKGISVSVFVQGCPHKCKGCFNESTWDFEGGTPIEEDFLDNLITLISKNGIKRNFSILGGEPLCEENLVFTDMMVSTIRAAYPEIQIYVWTGYTLEQLKNKRCELIRSILSKIDVLIDGPFIEELRDITLELRGSSNQRILKKGIDF